MAGVQSDDGASSDASNRSNIWRRLREERNRSRSSRATHPPASARARSAVAPYGAQYDDARSEGAGSDSGYASESGMGVRSARWPPSRRRREARAGSRAAPGMVDGAAAGAVAAARYPQGAAQGGADALPATGKLQIVIESLEKVHETPEEALNYLLAEDGAKQDGVSEVVITEAISHFADVARAERRRVAAHRATVDSTAERAACQERSLSDR